MEFRQHWLKDWHYSLAKEEENIHSTQGSPLQASSLLLWLSPAPACAGLSSEQTTETSPELTSTEGEAFTRGFFHLDCHNDTQPGTIHCQGSIMSFLCNVCDYLSNCHDIVCQFLLLNRGRQTERGRETQMFIWWRYLNARDKIRQIRHTQWKVTLTEWLECCGCLGDVLKLRDETSSFSPLICPAQTQVSQDYVERAFLCLQQSGWVAVGGYTSENTLIGLLPIISLSAQVVSNYQTLLNLMKIFSHFQPSPKVFSFKLSSFPFTGLTDKLIVFEKGATKRGLEFVIKI